MDVTRLGDCIGSQGMVDDEPKAVKVFGKTGSPQCYAIRDSLYRNDVPFDWAELRTDEDNSAIGLEGGSDGRLPVCAFPDGTRLENPKVQPQSSPQ